MTSHGIGEKQPQNLEEWTELLCAQDMPIFSNTAQNIYALLDDRKKGAIELANVILQDPNLTAKLLKVGNSPLYNPSRQKMSTVSRAIVVLGAEVIRELTLACSFFESVLSSSNKEHANREIARAIHAAVQARDFALAVNDSSPEEVFVAALLQNVGQIAFWCCSHPQTQKLHGLLDNSALSNQQIEKQLLGFTLADLSKKLCKTWRLGGLIEEAINQPNNPNPRAQLVHLGGKICRAIDSGWDSEAMHSCLKNLQNYQAETTEQLIVRIKNNTLKAVDIARQFGANDASQFIAPELTPVVASNKGDPKQSKKQLQFQILQDISSHISGNIDLQVLFQMVLEGIQRGVEMDRTLFMLLNPKKQLLSEKLALGWFKLNSAEKIEIRQQIPANALFYALQADQPCWLTPAQHATLYTEEMVNKLGKHECVLLPIEVEHKAVGLIYADRANSQIPLNADDFAAAKHFAEQAVIGLALYRMKSN